jgi:hypothetical protein
MVTELMRDYGMEDVSARDRRVLEQLVREPEGTVRGLFIEHQSGLDCWNGIGS